MLQSGGAGQLESWYEYSQLEPFGDDYRRTSAAMARLCNTIKIQAGRFTPGPALSGKDLMRDDFLVPRQRKQKPSKKSKLVHSIHILENIEGI
jgi:hypothetical protein